MPVGIGSSTDGAWEVGGTRVRALARQEQDKFVIKGEVGEVRGGSADFRGMAQISQQRFVPWGKKETARFGFVGSVWAGAPL